MRSGVARAEPEPAIAGLYGAFEEYSLKGRIDVRPHGNLDAAGRRIQLSPLGGLTWADLGIYSFKALTSFGDGDDFRHFLPRPLELYVVGHAGAPYTLFVPAHELETAVWTTWPAEETAALREFIAPWKRVLTAESRESGEAAWAVDEPNGAIAAL